MLPKLSTGGGRCLKARVAPGDLSRDGTDDWEGGWFAFLLFVMSPKAGRRRGRVEEAVAEDWVDLKDGLSECEVFGFDFGNWFRGVSGLRAEGICFLGFFFVRDWRLEGGGMFSESEMGRRSMSSIQ